MPHFPSNSKSTTKSLGELDGGDGGASPEEREDEAGCDDEAIENSNNMAEESKMADLEDGLKIGGPSNGLLVDLGSQDSNNSAATTSNSGFVDEKAILPLSEETSNGAQSSVDMAAENIRSNITDDEKSFRQNSTSSAYSSMIASSYNSLKSATNDKVCQG